MKCPFCMQPDSKVIDSRPTDEASSIRRRRECLSCAKRFTTYEVVESMPIMITKKDGSQQEFDREKLLRGLLRACEKRPVTNKMLDELVNDIVSTMQNEFQSETESWQLGEMVLSKLRDLDEVAYIRFASVYRRFTDIDSFKNELDNMKLKKE